MVVVLVVAVPESTVRAPKAPLDITGAILLAGALVGILTPISLGGSWGWTSPLTLGVFAVGIALAVIWFLQARRVKSPVIAVREFTHAPLLITLIISTFGLNAMAVIFQTTGGAGFTIAALSPLPEPAHLLPPGLNKEKAPVRRGSRRDSVTSVDPSAQPSH